MNTWSHRPVHGNAFAEREYRDSLSPTIEYHEFLKTPEQGKAQPITVNLPTTVPTNMDKQKRQNNIQPATPLVPGYVAGLRSIYVKDRAATDSVVPKPLNVLAKVNGSHSRKSLEFHSSPNGDSPSNAFSNLTPPYSGGDLATVIGTGFAASESQPLSTFRASESAIHNSPADTSMDTRQTKSHPVQYKPLSPNVQVSAAEPVRQDESSPAQYSSSSRHDPISSYDNPPHPDAIVLGDGQMSPTRDGTFGRLGNVNIQTAHRVPSMTGLVGNVGDFDTPQPSPSSFYSEAPQKHDIRPPVPPKATFRHALESGHVNARAVSESSIPVVFRGQAEEVTPTEPVFEPGPFLNSVPPPPGVQDSLTSDQKMVALVMGVHHHIDQEMSAIAHSINAKHDITVDHLIRRHQNAMDASGKSMHELGSRIGGLERGLAKAEDNAQALNGAIEATLRKHEEDTRGLHRKRHGDITEGMTSLSVKSDKIISLLETLHRRVENVEARVEMGRCRCMDNGAVPLGSRNAFAPGVVPAPPRRDVPDLRDHPAYAGYHSTPPPGQGPGFPQFSNGSWYQQATYHPAQ